MVSDRHDVAPAMEATPVDSGLRLWWFGGPSYAIKSAHSILHVDPYHSGPRADDPKGFIRDIPNYLFPEDISRADLVLSTHDHTDHCDPATLNPIAARTDAVFAVAPSSAKRMLAWGFASERLRLMAPGGMLRQGDLMLTTYPSRDWDDSEAVTFVLHAAGKTIFIGGDTLFFDGLAQIGRAHQIDLAVFALARNRPDIIDSPLYLTPGELAQAARTLGARRVLPIHWDIWQAWREDPHLVAPHLAGSETEVVILEQGESLVI